MRPECLRRRTSTTTMMTMSTMTTPAIPAAIGMRDAEEEEVLAAPFPLVIKPFNTMKGMSKWRKSNVFKKTPEK